jgi:hypothetical protein
MTNKIDAIAKSKSNPVVTNENVRLLLSPILWTTYKSTKNPKQIRINAKRGRAPTERNSRNCSDMQCRSWTHPPLVKRKTSARTCKTQLKAYFEPFPSDVAGLTKSSIDPKTRYRRKVQRKCLNIAKKGYNFKPKRPNELRTDEAALAAVTS